MSQPETIERSYTFPKKERLHSKKLIEELFSKGSHFYLYPFKVLYLPVQEESEGRHQVLISVSKRKFKRAPDRNLIKRRIREAYRLNKHILYSTSSGQHSYSIAYIYTGKESHPFQFIQNRLSKSLRRLSKEIEKSDHEKT